jgi:uncharacterized protein (TIGR02996 family)
MVTLDGMIRAADLGDRTDRLMLADALEEAGQPKAAAAMRAGRLRSVAAVEMATARRAECTLAAWLKQGPGLIRANPQIVLQVRGLAPHRRGDRWHWYRSDDRGNARERRPARSLLPPEIYPFVVGTTPHGRFASPEEAARRLSRGLVLWAQVAGAAP